MKTLARETEDLARDVSIRTAVLELIKAEEAGEMIEDQAVEIQQAGKTVKVIIRRVPRR